MRYSTQYLESFIIFLYLYFKNLKFFNLLKNIKGNRGFGDWGLGIGDWGECPIDIV